MEINEYEKKIYSQNGEDGIIEEIFKRIGVTNKFFVEFGVRDGLECNSRLLRERGWKGVWMDSENENEQIHKFFITAENIESVFESLYVPKEFDFLSIDVDGNDFWIWKSLTNYIPRCLVIEYNSQLPPEQKLTIPYDPNFKWSRKPVSDDFFGASLGAMIELGKIKGYSYIGVNKVIGKKYVNAFFVKSEFFSLFDNIDIPSKIYKRNHHDDKKFTNMINPFI